MENQENQEPAPEEEFLEARIDGISLTNAGFVIFLKCGGDKRALPIFIGTNEAQSIALALNREPPPRPMTHDLIKNMLEFLDSAVTRVDIHDLQDNTFFGRVFVNKGGIDEVEFDARPSDAIALAIRWQAPIFVSSRVFNLAAMEAPAAEEGPGEGGESAPPGETTLPSPLSPVEKLNEDLEKAVREERYEDAVRIRDQLKKIHRGN